MVWGLLLSAPTQHVEAVVLVRQKDEASGVDEDVLRLSDQSAGKQTASLNGVRGHEVGDFARQPRVADVVDAQPALKYVRYAADSSSSRYGFPCAWWRLCGPKRPPRSQKFFHGEPSGGAGSGNSEIAGLPAAGWEAPPLELWPLLIVLAMDFMIVRRGSHFWPRGFPWPLRGILLALVTALAFVMDSGPNQAFIYFQF